ncbi:ornithine cyclodeaminase [Methylosinus sp. RM1]|uniref:ornithine cyclodeaminase n=1 Tax=Methylosinus sp. RM1 TaxID=2583817 RepID=UPI00140C6498|nr:ornithine cyclodeaminase [Methylosinus sp. RM1]
MSDGIRQITDGALPVLSQATLGRLEIDYCEVIRVVENAFIALRTGDSENPLKTIVQPRDKRSLGYSMVGRDGASKTVGFKVVYEFDPERTKNAYRFHSFIFLCDDLTGMPIAMLDVVELGPLRTSATSALMARAAHPCAANALVVGSGVQGQIALPMLVAAIPGLSRLQIFGTHQAGLHVARENVEKRYPGQTVEFVSDLEEAARHADIVVGAAGLSSKQFVRHGWMKPGAVAVLLGYGVDADVFHGADFRIATDTSQMLVTCNDLAGPNGEIPTVDAELPDILLGRAMARRSDRDVVFAYNSGMVVTDVALGRYLADRALAQDLGERVKLW